MYCYGIIYTLCTETKHTTTVNLRDKYPDALYDRVTAHWTAGYRAGAVETTTNVTTIQQYHVRLLRKKTRQWNKEKDIPVPWTRKITHFLQRTTQYSSRMEGGWWGVKWFSGGTEGGIVRIQQNLMEGSGKFYCYNQILWPPPLPPPSSAQELTIKTWAFLRYFSLNELQNIQTVCQRS